MTSEVDRIIKCETCKDGIMADVRKRITLSLCLKIISVVSGVFAVLLGITFAMGRETADAVNVNGNRITRIEGQMDKLDAIYQVIVMKKTP